MKNRQILIVGALAVVVGAYFFSSYLGSLKEPPRVRKQPEVKKFVATAPVSYSDVSTEVITFGRVENAQSLDLIAEVSGRMTQGVLLKEGQRFNRGDLLFQVDQEEAVLDLKSQKSEFLRDLAGILPDLKVDFPSSFDSWKTYFDQLSVEQAFPPIPETKTSKEKTFIATRGLLSSYYDIKSSEARLEKYKYYAPFNGSISEVVMQSGSFVNAGTRVGKVLRIGRYEVKASIETQEIPWIQKGSEVRVIARETGQSFDGFVSRISDYVNPNTQSIDVFVAIEPNGKHIYEGQFLEVIIPARTIERGMVIPRNAIYNGNEVFVLQDSLLKRTSINVIRLTKEQAIVNGLEDQSDVVVEPLLGAYNNMKAFKKDTKEIDLELRKESSGKLTTAE